MLITNLLVFMYAGLATAEEGGRPRVIAGFGSSVCDGWGDHFGKGGYIGRLEDTLADRGWQVVDVSRGGDNTIIIQDRWEKTDVPPSKPVDTGRFLLPHEPGYVLIGLSLGNEGIMTDDPDRRTEVFNQFHDGMLGIIERCRAEGIRPIVVNCYASAAFETAEYDVTKRMNVLINSWDVPSVNMLGAIDDGQGRWAPGFLRDDWHPSGGGYEEMFLAIVPTLFDAMAEGKPIPQRADQDGYAHIEPADGSALQFEPGHTVHAFANGFWFRCEGDGVLASTLGHVGRLETTAEDFGDTSRVAAGDERFVATVAVDQNGELVYRGAGDTIIRSKALVNDGQWHQVVVSHRPAMGRTLVFLDGRRVGMTDERLIPEVFTLGGTAAFDVRDWLVYRSSLNIHEVSALWDGSMIHSSLEVYAPLREAQYNPGQMVENRAQSLSQVIVQTDAISSHVQNHNERVPLQQ